MDDRLNPELLLKSVQDEERRHGRGKLKIYLGAAPGVGKTHTMLEDAISLEHHGVDVIVGLVESHGRSEIEALLQKLPVIDRLKIPYRGQTLTEFDLDAALERKPKLILVDEMAHTNAPSSRHTKRWQDIKELLDRNIDVYTTLNVQHIESLKDDVAQIIHAPIHETVPDSMLELADTIELIDLPPEELLERLKEGKIYFPERAELASRHFFRKGNLIALRELALRKTAERVESQVLLYRQGEGIRHIWKAREKILVCVGADVDSAKLIRSACQTALNLKASWVAVHVKTPHHEASLAEKNIVVANLQLAEQLGAETRILTGFDIVKEIMQFAREQNVTQIMICKHIRPRWRNLFKRNLSDELVRASGEINVFIVTTHATPLPKSKAPSKKSNWMLYLLGIVLACLATGLNYIIYTHERSANFILIYLLAIIAIALFGQTGPAIFMSIICVITYYYIFVPPFYSLALTNAEYVFTFAVTLLMTQVISHLTILTRRQSEAAKFAERQTSLLYQLSRKLSNTRGVEKLSAIGTEYLSKVFASEVALLLPHDNHLEVCPPTTLHEVMTNDKEMTVAQWAYEMGQSAGLGTNTLPFSNTIYVPLLGSKSTLGVLCVKPEQTAERFSPEQMHLLEASANQMALAIEVDRIQEQMRESEMLTESNRVRNALLQSVSHELQAPIISIIASASTQIEMRNKMKKEEQLQHANNIYMEALQLNRLINNLLQISYLESSTIRLQKEECVLIDIIRTVIATYGDKIKDHDIRIHTETTLPIVFVDRVLIQQVFINLIDNAIKFSPPNTTIDITLQHEQNHILASIEDRGEGIAQDEIHLLFEKFYRGRLIKTERGLGIGLAICRYIIEAHGGTIGAKNREGGGAYFYFTLPF